jgi:hypothetical protein
MKAVLDIRDHKASFVMELLNNFSFVKVQSPTLSSPQTKEIADSRKKDIRKDFFAECFGMWENRDIDADTLRKQAWGIE